MNDNPGMVDVSNKQVTTRIATAVGTINLGAAAFDVLTAGTCNKGDVLATARVATVQAVKSTQSLIPLCHSLLIEAVTVDFDLDDDHKSATVKVTVKSSGKTGVEMEALTAASVGCLTIYDMLKYPGQGMTISDIKLLEKQGGKSGHYKRQN
jgi:cyclic pyranopterin phosphate synthase